MSAIAEIMIPVKIAKYGVGSVVGYAIANKDKISDVIEELQIIQQWIGDLIGILKKMVWKKHVCPEPVRLSNRELRLVAEQLGVSKNGSRKKLVKRIKRKLK